MFGLSSVRYESFSVGVNFGSIISGLSSSRISIRSVWVIRVGSLLPGLILSLLLLPLWNILFQIQIGLCLKVNSSLISLDLET